MQKCLVECDRLKLSSIAFPALGTGALHFPPEVSAELMITTAIDFMKEKHHSIRAIHIVVYQENMYSVFQSALLRTQSSGGIRRGHIEKMMKSKSVTDKHEAMSAPGIYTIDSVTINIIQGDITDESSDAIINSTSQNMQLVETGVCGALLKKAGPDLQRDCDAFIAQHQELRSGDVATTPACGNLKCKTIFHVNYDPKSKLLSETICACLTKAEELRYSTVSFPALGTGNHQCSPDSAAHQMQEGIKLFVTTRTTQILKSIRIVIFLPDMYKPFIDVFNQIFSPSEPWYQKLYHRTVEVGQYLWSKKEQNKEVDESDHFDNICITTSICLNVYGETNESVSAAEQKICTIIDRNYESAVIDSTLINDIPKSDLEELIKFSEESGVQLSIDRAPLNQIKLYGESHKCSKVHSHVQSVLHSHQNRAQMLEKANMLQMRVEWHRKCSDGTYRAYEILENYNIEKEYELQSKEYIHFDRQDYFKIDFGNNLEIDAAGNTTLVKRIDKTIEGKDIAHK